MSLDDEPRTIVVIPAARQTVPANWSGDPMPDWPSDYAWRNCGKDETGQRQYNYRRPDEVLAVIASTVVVGDDGRWHNG